MSNNKEKRIELVPEVSPIPIPIRKLRKLKKDPKKFIIDSKPYIQIMKLGSFAFVLAASGFVVFYYMEMASPRYATQVQFVVKQASSNDLSVGGLAALGASSPSTKDALILKEFIQSSEMAKKLNERMQLKDHFESMQWDWLSRLALNSTQEEYLSYFKNRIKVYYDDLSEILKVEVQSFDAAYSLELTRALTEISENFINDLGKGIAVQQTTFAQEEVERAYQRLQSDKSLLIDFQDKFQILNPELQSTSILSAISKLESNIITLESEIKSLLSYMQPSSSEIKSKEYQLDALNRQLEEEKEKLTNKNVDSLNKVNSNYKEIELNANISADLYKSALASLEMVRIDAMKNIKHLLVIESPKKAEESLYPQRLHGILTWFVILMMTYGIGRLVLAVIKDHKE